MYWARRHRETPAAWTRTTDRITDRLFSSGPVTDRSKPDDPADRRQGDQIAEALAAREHRVFRGKLDKSGLSIAERALVRIAKTPSEDQRDWEAIRTWAAEIGAALIDSRPLHPAAD